MSRETRNITSQSEQSLSHPEKKLHPVKLVGFGPGDPELITVKGQKALEQATIIFYDDLTNESFLNQFTAQKVYVGKRSGKHSHNQDEINELVYQAAIESHKVVRLKGGDPMIFAHGREEIDYLKSRSIEVEVIPGISSGNALASLTQIPLTHRGVARSVAFVLGHAKNTLTPDSDTLIYYMGGSEVSRIAQALLEKGRDDTTPVALVTNVSLPDQHEVYSTLRELKYAVFKDTPVLIVVGEVVNFASQYHLHKTYIADEPNDSTLDEFDKVEFSSPSSVESFKQLYGTNIPKKLLFISKDEATYQAVQTIQTI